MEDTSHLSKQLVVKPVKQSLQNTVFWGRFMLIGVQPGFASPKGVLYMAMAAMLPCYCSRRNWHKAFPKGKTLDFQPSAAAVAEPLFSLAGEKKSVKAAFEYMVLIFDGKADQILGQMLQKTPHLTPENMMQNQELQDQGLFVWQEVEKLLLEEQRQTVTESAAEAAVEEPASAAAGDQSQSEPVPEPICAEASEHPTEEPMVEAGKSKKVCFSVPFSICCFGRPDIEVEVYLCYTHIGEYVLIRYKHCRQSSPFLVQSVREQ